ncbi:MAG TPA: VOC family protein [Acidimicrobiales bacterium]|nr:VOC family protein [Acidimicrobiales bacterium]
MITLLHGCFHVELTVGDLESARDFMTDVLGAGPIEQRLAAEIQALLPRSGYRVDHLDCGQATFQVNQPPAASGSYRGSKSVHQANLERIGPCVSNLNFYVDDIAHAQAMLSGLGAAIRTEGPSTAVPSLADYGPTNTRVGGDDRPFLFMGTRDLIGLDLEIMEPNFQRFAEQTAQYPCFSRPEAPRPGGALRLERLQIAVPDLHSTYRNLVQIFAPASLSQPSQPEDQSKARAFRVWLGGIELEYLRPSGQGEAVAAFLQQYGPGVMTIEFSACDPAGIASRSRTDWSLASDRHLDPNDDLRSTWLIRSREVVGFDVGLAHPANAFVVDG